MYLFIASVIFFSSIMLFNFRYVEFYLNVVRYISFHRALYHAVEIPSEVEIKIILTLAVGLVTVLYHLYIFVRFQHDAVVGLMNCEYVFHCCAYDRLMEHFNDAVKLISKQEVIIQTYEQKLKEIEKEAQQ